MPPSRAGWYAAKAGSFLRLEQIIIERIVICLAVIVSYASVWPNEFVFDDIDLIVQNVFLKHWDNVSAFLSSQGLGWFEQAGIFYRPVPQLLHFLIYQAFGLSTIAFHALNITLQALNACLLHHFGRRAGFKKGAAFAAALLWAVHPLHTEAVAYMSSTPELLWSTFCLLGLIALLPDFTPRRMAAALIFFILALGSKGSAVIFPALAAIMLFFVSKDRQKFSTYLKTWPLWVLAAGYLIGLMAFMHGAGYTVNQGQDPLFFQNYTSNIINRILTCFATLPFYAGLIVWPAGLHMERDFPVFTSLLRWPVAGGILIAGLGFMQILWGRAQRGLAVSFGLLWFAVALFPAAGIIFPINALLSEHWLYMPMMGLFLGAAQTGAGFFKKQRTIAPLLVFMMAAVLGTATFLQNEKWRNPETFYQNIVQNGGNPSRAISHLCSYYLERGEFDKAIVLSRDEMNRPGVEPYMIQALALLHVQPDEDGKVGSVDDILRFIKSSPHIPEAINELGQALNVDPDYYLAHQYLAIIYRYQGNKAMADFNEERVKEIFQKNAGRTGP